MKARDVGNEDRVLVDPAVSSVSWRFRCKQCIKFLYMQWNHATPLNHDVPFGAALSGDGCDRAESCNATKRRPLDRDRNGVNEREKALGGHLTVATEVTPGAGMTSQVLALSGARQCSRYSVEQGITVCHRTEARKNLRSSPFLIETGSWETQMSHTLRTTHTMSAMTIIVPRMPPIYIRISVDACESLLAHIQASLSGRYRT